jgi:hypothetical protein
MFVQQASMFLHRNSPPHLSLSIRRASSFRIRRTWPRFRRSLLVRNRVSKWDYTFGREGYGGLIGGWEVMEGWMGGGRLWRVDWGVGGYGGLIRGWEDYGGLIGGWEDYGGLMLGKRFDCECGCVSEWCECRVLSMAVVMLFGWMAWVVHSCSFRVRCSRISSHLFCTFSVSFVHVW